MIFNCLIVFISIILENIFNLYLNSFRYITPLFTLMSLIFIFPYFNDSRRDYLIFSLIIGLLYDIFFTNFYILNAIVFFITSICIYYILSTHNFNYITVLICSVFSIFLYNVLLYFLFNFFNYTDYTLSDLSYILRHFLLGNILYISIIYLILKNRHFNHIIRI